MRRGKENLNPNRVAMKIKKRQKSEEDDSVADEREEETATLNSNMASMGLAFQPLRVKKS